MSRNENCQRGTSGTTVFRYGESYLASVQERPTKENQRALGQGAGHGTDDPK